VHVNDVWGEVGEDGTGIGVNGNMNEFDAGDHCVSGASVHNGHAIAAVGQCPHQIQKMCFRAADVTTVRRPHDDVRHRSGRRDGTSRS